MSKETPLDLFGKLLVEHLRDAGIGHVDGLLAAHFKAPSLKGLQRDLRALSKAERDVVRRACIASLDAAVHDFLFALQEQADGDGPVRVRVRGKDLATLSDGLQGEPFGSEGWYARYSAHGEPPEEA